MSPDIIIGAVIAVTPISLAVQHAIHRSRDQEAAEVWSMLALEAGAKAKAEQERLLRVIADQVDEHKRLSDELTSERRRSAILRDGMLDAERRVTEIREFLTVIEDAS